VRRDRERERRRGRQKRDVHFQSEIGKRKAERLREKKRKRESFLVSVVSGWRNRDAFSLRLHTLMPTSKSSPHHYSIPPYT
jgi:hypothetical protein